MQGTGGTGAASSRTKKAGGEKFCVNCGGSGKGLEEALEWVRSFLVQGVAAGGSCESCELLPELCRDSTGCEEAASVQDSEQGEAG